MKIGIVTMNTPERQRMFMEHAYPEMEISVVAATAAEEEKADACRDADAVIMNAPGISLEFLKDCPNVKLLQSTFTGYDNIDIKGINDLGIAFANNGGGNAIPVAEYTMGLINGVTRGVFRGVQNAREGNWNIGLREFPTWELTGPRTTTGRELYENWNSDLEQRRAAQAVHGASLPGDGNACCGRLGF